VHTLAWKSARNSVLRIVCDALMCSEIIRCTFNDQRSDSLSCSYVVIDAR